MPERRLPPAAAALLALASRLVPRHARAAWRREWEAELAAAADEGRAVLRLALGAVADARAAGGAARAVEHGHSGGGWAMTIDDLVRETKRAARSLGRAPGFTAAAVVTLGAGLAGVAALFTLVHAILLRPLPYPGAERLVSVYHTMTAAGASGVDWPLTRHGYLHVKGAVRAFEAWGGHLAPDAVGLAGDEGPAERVTAVAATPELWEVLGASAAAGRLFGAEEARPGAAPVVVLSHGLWQRRFGGDPGAVGRTVRVDGEARQVVGVMAEGVDLPTREVDLWSPLAIDPAARPTDEFRVQVLARLAREASPETAAAEVEAAAARLPEVAPFFAILLDQMGLRTHVRSVREEVVGDVERALWILLGAVGVVLLVAVANVANLFLVRTEGRRGEVAVRTALGARRGHLLALFLGESALVALAAGVVAVVGASAGVRTLVALAPPSIPRLDGLQVGGATVAVVAALGVAVALALGLYPWARFGGGRAGGPGSRGARGAGRREAVAGGALVVAQVALALVLLSASALLFRSFQNLRAVDPGFRADGVLAADVSLPADRYATDLQAHQAITDLEARLAALPGVRAVAFGPSPIDGPRGCSAVMVEGMPIADDAMPPCAPMAQVTPSYFGLLGMRVVRGRGFTPADAAERAGVVVVSSNLAERLWPGEDPVGRGLRPASRRAEFLRVVGVVDPVRAEGLHAPPTEMIYFPSLLPEGWGWPLRGGRLMIGTEPGRETALAPALRRVVAELDPSAPVSVAGTLEEEVARSMVRTSFTLVLLGTAASMALVLGLVGLYGVVAWRVGARRAEFGIRMAMGAGRAEVRNLVLGHSLRLAAGGVALGLGAAVVLNRLLASLLHGVRPGDPWVLAATAAVLLLTAGVAAWLPAERATRVDPAVTLRAE